MNRSLISAASLACCAFGLFSSNPSSATVYVAFGDSITDGTGGDPKFDEEGKGGYPGRLQTLLRAEGGSRDTVRNEGIGSLDTEEALNGPIQAALNRGGDTMLLMLGTNDVKPISRGERSVETVKANLDALRDKAKARGMATIMATIIPRIKNSSADPNNGITFAIVEAIRALQAKNGRSLADPWEIFARIPQRERDATYYSPGETVIGHPNAAGFALIAETIGDTILGIDTLEPLKGPFRLDPFLGDQKISKDQAFELVLYDHLSGIDRKATTLFVNGKEAEDTEVTSTGDRKKATIKLELSKFKDCKLRLEVVSQDRAEPPNILDLRLIEDFRIQGRNFWRGDVDFDCRVDGVDLVLFAFHFGAKKGDPRYDEAADFDGNSEIDGVDLGLLSRNFGRTAK